MVQKEFLPIIPHPIPVSDGSECGKERGGSRAERNERRKKEGRKKGRERGERRREKRKYKGRDIRKESKEINQKVRSRSLRTKQPPDSFRELVLPKL